MHFFPLKIKIYDSGIKNNQIKKIIKEIVCKKKLKFWGKFQVNKVIVCSTAGDCYSVEGN